MRGYYLGSLDRESGGRRAELEDEASAFFVRVQAVDYTLLLVGVRLPGAVGGKASEF